MPVPGILLSVRAGRPGQIKPLNPKYGVAKGRHSRLSGINSTMGEVDTMTLAHGQLSAYDHWEVYIHPLRKQLVGTAPAWERTFGHSPMITFGNRPAPSNRPNAGSRLLKQKRMRRY